jgi:NDP-sugar pyrophosphorylase family protein
MNLTLLIMAAGIGSRFGGGIKQLEPVDARGHIIMDYSIFDAKEAGFNKVVFVIRKDIEEEFKNVIGNRVKGVQVEYCFQDINDIPGTVPEGRTKPWGTGQAILAAREVIDSPFVVINADDYYGKEGFVKLADYLKSGGECCMAGFVLKNTLSDNGTVTRGICVEEDGWLKEIVETNGIGKDTKLDLNSLVSMNMWGLKPEFMNELEKGFKEFFKKEVLSDPLKSEFLVPTFIGQLLEQKRINVKVLKSSDTWYGMTYKEDGPTVRDSIEKLVKDGSYPEDM